MKKILIVNQDSGYLTIDVANVFAKEYDEVVVIYGRNRQTERHFHSKIKIHSSFAYNRSSIFTRLCTWLLFTIHLFFSIAFKYRKFHILYYTNPPFSYFNALIFSNKFSIIVFDIYPDILSIKGINESSIVYKLWSHINRKVFSKAVQIITLSESMKKRLTHYIADNKIKVVPVWPASENFKPIEKKINPFLKKHKWTDKFILLYSGNMGYGHYLEPLIEVAQKVNQFKDIIFLFIGEGAKKTKLQDLVKDKGLCNVHFLTWQEHEILPYSLASGDIALVSQESETSYSSIPSKTFNYMAVGAPLIGIGKYGSDLQRIIEENNIGFYIDIDNFRDIEAIILNLYESRDSLTVLSRKSYETSKKYSHELSLDYLF